jgi:hypothetical protein
MSGCTSARSRLLGHARPRRAMATNPVGWAKAAEGLRAHALAQFLLARFMQRGHGALFARLCPPYDLRISRHR